MSLASVERERVIWDWRCRVARRLILFAILVVLPRGRCRRELNELMNVWSLRVQTVIAVERARQRDASGG